MTDTSPVDVTIEGALATVTMRRPEVHNAFDSGLIAALREAFDRLAAAPAVRVIVLAGEGRSFSAGADLNWMRRAIELSVEENIADAERMAAMLRSVATCPKPVIARIQGGAYGGGVGLVAAVDWAIAADTARFGFTEARLGLVPATIAPWAVAKIGAGWARKLFLTAELIDAEFALRLGLVHAVVPPERLDAAVAEAVALLLANGSRAMADCKALVTAVDGHTEPAIDAYTARMIAEARTRGEGQEGVRAFLGKRKPVWAE